MEQALSAPTASARYPASIIEGPLEPDESDTKSEVAAASPAPAALESPKTPPVAFPSRPRHRVIPAAEVPPAFNPVAASSPVTELPVLAEFPEPPAPVAADAASPETSVSNQLESAKPEPPKIPSLPSRLPSLPTRPAALPRKSASFFSTAPSPEAVVTRDPAFLPDDRFGFKRPEAGSSGQVASPAKWKTSTWVAIFVVVALAAGWVAGHGSWRTGFQQAPGRDTNATVTEEDVSEPSAPPPTQIEVIDVNNQRWMIPIAPAAGRATAVATSKSADGSQAASANSPGAHSASNTPQNSSDGSKPAPAVVSSSSVALRNVSSTNATSDVRNSTLPSPQQDVVQNDLLPGELIHKVEPEYPAAALDQRVEGAVKIMAVIDVNGNVKSAQPLSGPRLLIPAALDAVRQWKYGPTTLHGQAIETQRQITIAFEVSKAE
jgi:TonB family protein